MMEFTVTAKCGHQQYVCMPQTAGYREWWDKVNEAREHICTVCQTETPVSDRQSPSGDYESPEPDSDIPWGSVAEWNRRND